MKVGICSDVHVHRYDQSNEIQALIEYVNTHRDLDVLICAGDLSHHFDEVRGFLESITSIVRGPGSRAITISGSLTRSQSRIPRIIDIA